MKNKYRAKPITIDGIRFASTKEGKRYRELKLLEREGHITELQLQPAFPIVVNGHKICIYKADFRYVENGVAVVEDVKSPATAKMPVYRLKKKLVEAIYPVKILET